MGSAKLEFYRFQLNPKRRRNEVRTFRDFYFDEIVGGEKDDAVTDEKILDGLFKHFSKCLNGKLASDNGLRKAIKVVKDKKVNKFHARMPKLDKTNSIISGVINGGTYGLMRILADMTDDEKLSELTKKDAVLSYFYFLLHIPADHHEGSFIIHSNGRDESITTMFRQLITNVFGGAENSNYNRAKYESFCPKAFQDEFREGASVASLTFRDSFLPRNFNNRGPNANIGEFELTVTANFKDDVPISKVQRAYNFLASLGLGKQKSIEKLGDFTDAKVEYANADTKSRKTFEWDTRDDAFVPVIYLDGRINDFNEDGTPDFGELSALCLKYHREMVLPELRKDLKDGE